MAITAGSAIVASDFISVSAGAGDAGKAPKLNAAGQLDPSFTKTPTVQVFTANGTYTAPAGLKYAIIELVGGGSAGNGSAGGCGAAYIKKLLSAATIGASQTVTIGAGGASSADNTTQNPGNDTTFGALLTAAKGGLTTPGAASGGDVNIDGGQASLQTTDAQPSGGAAFYTGCGGDSFMGHGNKIMQSVNPTGSIVNGNTGTGYGCGGGGGLSTSFGNHSNNGAGKGGICIVTEFYN